MDIKLINAMKKAFSLMFAVMLLVTGGVNRLFNGDVYKFKYETAVVGIETLTRCQGVTNDGESWYFSGKNCLERVSIKTDEILALNTNAIPEEFAENFGSKHIGGLGYAKGKIYAPIEDSKVWKHPLIAVYSADTLEFTGEYLELSTHRHTRGVPWCFADAENNILYAGDSREEVRAYMYDLTTFEFLGTLEYSQPLDNIQGGEYYNGKLYFGTNDITRGVYTVDVSTGQVAKLFDRIAYEYKLIDNFGGEGEDITICPLENGTWLHTLQLGALFVDSALRHYE